MCDLRRRGLAILVVLAMAGAAWAQGIENRAWIAERIGGQAVGGDTRPTVTIAGGRVTGSGGCNRLMGSATISGDGISFTGLATTRMACPGPVMAQEKAFLDALMAARTFRLEAGSLSLQDAAGNELARLKAQS
jgi:heat shock protein HslJ